jgi:hypothetical protein
MMRKERRSPDLNRDIQRKLALKASAVPDCATAAKIYLFMLVIKVYL